MRVIDDVRLKLRSGLVHEASQLARDQLEALAGTDVVVAAAICNLLGNVFVSAGYYQAALQLDEAGLSALAQGRAAFPNEVREALDKLQQTGKGVQSLPTLTVGLELDMIDVREIGDADSQGKERAKVETALLSNVGSLYLLQRQFSQADDLFRRAIARAEGAELDDIRRRVSANLAWSAIEQGSWDEADRLLEAALQGTVLEKAPSVYRYSVMALGERRRLQGRLDEAVRLLTRAVSMHEAITDQRGHRRAITHLANAYLETGRAADAKRVLLEEPADDFSRDRDIENEMYRSAVLARCERRLGNFEASLQAFRACIAALDQIGSSWLTEEGGLSFRQSQDALLDDYVATAAEAALKSQSYQAVKEAAEAGRSRSLLNLVSKRPIWPERRPGETDARLLFINGVSRYNEPRSPRVLAEPPDLDAWSNLDPRVQHAPHTAAEPLETMLIDADVPAGASTGPPSATILEYYVLPDQTLALVTDRKGNVHGLAIPITRQALESRVNEYAAAIGVGDRAAIVRGVTLQRSDAHPRGDEAALARSLYDLLIRPVRLYLPVDVSEQVVIVPHRTLWLLPFASLSARNGSRLIDEFQILYANSVSSWQQISGMPRLKDHRNARAWIVGNPSLGGSLRICGHDLDFANLPGAEAEARKIARMFGPNAADVFIGTQADRLRLDSWHPGYSVIHLAAHAVACAERPLESTLILASLTEKEVVINDGPDNGKIFVRADPRLPVQLHGLPVRPWIKPRYYTGQLDAATIVRRYQLHADLVTLSACQTGLGEVLGEGMVGFTRAFQAAGARSLIVSLWSVDDDATAYLMTKFYQGYLKHGNKALALQDAMKTTRSVYPKPKSWAAFSLFGAAE